MPERKPFVVDAQKVQQGRLEIVHVHRVPRNIVPEFVRLAERKPFFDPAPGHPDGKTPGMVIASVIVRRKFALGVVGAPELAAPDDQRIVEHAALLEVQHEGRRGLVRILRQHADFPGKVRVLIPSLVVQLDEAHVALGQAAGQQAIGRERAGDAGRFAVQVENVVRLLGNVHRGGHRRLHPVGHFVLGDARIDFRVHYAFVLALVQFAQIVQHAPPGGSIDARRVIQIQYRVLARPKLHALVQRRQETVSPQTGIQGLIEIVAARKQHAERRQVFVFGPQAVTQPGADGGTPCLLRTRLEKGDGGIVVDCLRIH